MRGFAGVVSHFQLFIIQGVMTSNSHNLEPGIRQAAHKAVVPMVLTDATERITEGHRAVKAAAADKGVDLYIPTVRPKVVDGSEHFPTVLADLLCKEPSRARQSNDELMQVVSNLLDLDTPIKGNRMSKKFSTQARQHVRSVLTQAGYDSSGIENGTDIKRAVLKGKHGRPRTSTVHTTDTEFLADGVILDGVKYLYRRRERSPTGMAADDFCIRVAGADVPLLSVLKLRGFGRGQFGGLDSAAINDTERDAERLRNMPPDERERLEGQLRYLKSSKKRTASKNSQLKQLEKFLGSTEALERRTNVERTPREKKPSTKLQPSVAARVTAEDMVRAYWRNYSPVGRHTSGARELAGFFQGLMNDPAEFERTRKLVDAWQP